MLSYSHIVCKPTRTSRPIRTDKVCCMNNFLVIQRVVAGCLHQTCCYTALTLFKRLELRAKLNADPELIEMSSQSLFEDILTAFGDGGLNWLDH